jgi:hypothetical protein
MAICDILRTLGLFYDHLVHFVFIWYIVSGLGIMYQEKSGNPGLCHKNVFADGMSDLIAHLKEDSGRGVDHYVLDRKKAQWQGFVAIHVFVFPNKAG